MTRVNLRHLASAALALLLLSLVGARGCEKKQPQQPQSTPQQQSLPTVQVQLGNETFTLEIAATDQSRQTGLMHRNSMPADHGMIFVFPRQQHLSFWMRNTRIPLDIVYLNREGRVISIKQMKPFDEKGVPSDGPAMYAIELNEGTAASVGLKVGDVVAIPPSVTFAPR